VAQDTAAFKWHLKEASEAADRRSRSREFHTEGTAVEKACDAKYEVPAGFENNVTNTNLQHYEANEQS